MVEGHSGRTPSEEKDGGASPDVDVTQSDEGSRARGRMLAVVITGTYSWALTVLPPLAAHGAWSLDLSGAAAGVALLALLLAPFLPPGRLALVAALDVFVGFCILSWWAGRHQPIAPPFAVFGSFGWLAYTLALGSLSTPRDAQGQLDPGPRLEPRTAPRRLSAAALTAVLIVCLVLLAGAWTIDRPALAVLGHVLSLALVLLLLRSGAHVATYVQVRGTRLVRPLQLRPAILPLLSVLLLGGFGLVYFWLGH